MNGKKTVFSSSFLLLRYMRVVFLLCVDVSLFSFTEGHTHTYTTACYNERMIQKKSEKEKEEKSMQRGRNNRDRDHTCSMCNVHERMTLDNVVLLIRKTSIFIKYTNLLQLPSIFK